MDTLFRKLKVDNITLDQASGSKAKVQYIGSMSCIIGNSHLETKPKYSLGMPDNPTSTISTFALKKFGGFIKASHESNEFFRIIDRFGTETWFTQGNGMLMTINGLDYIPIIHPVNEVPTANQVHIRKSNRIPKPTVKMKQYLEQQKQLADNNDTMIVLPPCSEDSIPPAHDDDPTDIIDPVIDMRVSTLSKNINLDITVPSPES